jgi:hypothetical protein
MTEVKALPNPYYVWDRMTSAQKKDWKRMRHGYQIGEVRSVEFVSLDLLSYVGKGGPENCFNYKLTDLGEHLEDWRDEVRGRKTKHAEAST